MKFCILLALAAVVMLRNACLGLLLQASGDLAGAAALLNSSGFDLRNDAADVYVFLRRATAINALMTACIGLLGEVQPKDDGGGSGFSATCLEATTDALAEILAAHDCKAVVALDFGGDVALPDPPHVQRHRA